MSPALASGIFTTEPPGRPIWLGLSLSSSYLFSIIFVPCRTDYIISGAQGNMKMWGSCS